MAIFGPELELLLGVTLGVGIGSVGRDAVGDAAGAADEHAVIASALIKTRIFSGVFKTCMKCESTSL